MEEWRDVVGYEGIYQVSEFGNVRRVLGGTGTKLGSIRKPNIDDLGYSRVGLYAYPRSPRKYLVHILVAAAFIGPNPDRCHVNHKDGNPRNNHYSNLEYLTPTEHHYHTTHVLNHKLGPPAGHVPSAKLSNEKVAKIREMYATGNYYQRELSNEFGVSQSVIADVLNGRRWTHVPGKKNPGDSAHHSIRKGSDNGNSVLNEDKVKEIRILHDTHGTSIKELANHFKVSPGTIDFVIKRQTWKHVE